MWTSSFFLGNFVGPTLSGIFVENFGFRSTTLGFFVMFALNIMVDTMELFNKIYNSEDKLMAAAYKQLSDDDI